MGGPTPLVGVFQKQATARWRRSTEASAADLFDAIREDVLDAGPARAYAFDDIASAHRDLEGRQIIGAAVIKP